MAIDFNNFLAVFAAWLAARASIQYASTPRAMWVGTAIEGPHCADPYSVLAVYTGELPYGAPVPTLAVQCKTTGRVGADDQISSRAQTLFNALLDADNRPLRGLRLPVAPATAVWRINGIVNLRPPAPIGRDDRGQLAIVFNFDCKFLAL